jgi:3-hydroxyisobutyrate dehydrogenase-like beta-hydroxyacid dehydrogenase
MIEVLNAGSGATSASRDKFPRAILPRSFDYGFATGLMVKDVRLYLEEARTLGVPIELAETVSRLWEAAAQSQGPDSDFTSVIKPFERAAGVTVGPVTD